jgi:RNA polymerase sigma-70 factor (ECF subfamily)
MYLFFVYTIIRRQQNWKEGKYIMAKVSDNFLEELCKNTWKELYRFVYYKVQNREEAEDITQETYVKAISYLEKNNDKVLEYGSYLKAVAMNIIRDQWRLKKRKGSILNIEEINPEEFSSEDFADNVNEREMLQNSMQKLTKEQQTVINLRILEGYSVADTARLMQRKEGTVRVLQYRAIKALAQIMEEER